MKIVAYQDTRGEWRWRAIAANGRIVADGSEGYYSKSNVERAIESFISDMQLGVTFKVGTRKRSVSWITDAPAVSYKNIRRSLKEALQYSDKRTRRTRKAKR